MTINVASDFGSYSLIFVTIFTHYIHGLLNFQLYNILTFSTLNLSSFSPY